MIIKSPSRQRDRKDKRQGKIPLNEEPAFREIADFLIDSIFCINTDGYFTCVNRASIELLGISRDSLYESRFLDFVHAADRHLAKQNILRVINGETVSLYDLKLVLANGRERVMEIHSQAIRGDGGNTIGLLYIARDITERRLMEDTLRISEEKYRLFMEDANDAIIVSDANGYIIDVNKKAEELLGYPKEALYTMHYTQFHVERERSAAAFIDIMEKNVGGISNTAVRRKDGSTIPVDITSKAIEFAGRKVVRGSYQDISDHLQIKNKLERMVRERTAELDAKNEALLREIKEREQAEDRIRRLYSQLIKSQEMERQQISYDLHDHVAQDLFSLKISLDTFFADLPHIVNQNTEKISGLSEIVKRAISSIREIAHKLTPRDLKHLGLVPTISLYCRDYSKQYGVMVDFFPAGMDNVTIPFDIQITLYRILQECLTNIRKHAGATRVSVKLVMSFPTIILRVKDNGKGFDVQKEFTAAANGRRMGILSIDERVAILKGKMRIESRPMQGTEVVIEIPSSENQDE